MEENTNLYGDEINLGLIFRDLVRNLPLFVLAALTVLFGVQAYKNLGYHPEYTSTATMAVSARGTTDTSAYNSLKTSNSMAEVYSEVFGSDVMEEKIAEEMGELPEHTAITSELISETNMILVHVTAQDPKTAYQVMNSIMDNYTSVSDYLFGNAVLELVDEPKVPVEPSNEVNLMKLRVLGIAAIVCLLAAAIILCNILRSTVKTTACAKRRLEGQCLGSIPHEEQNRTLQAKLHKINKAVLISNPTIGFRFEESYHQLASRLDYHMKKKNQKVLMVTSVAENEGKSTVAANIAIAMAQRNKKVLMIDMDLEKPALYKIFDNRATYENSLLAYLDGQALLTDVLQKIPKTGVYTVLNRKAINDPLKYLNSESLQKLIRACRKVFDVIILDTAPFVAGSDTQALMEYADASLLVVRQDVVRISDLNDASETLQESDAEYIGYVLNDFESANENSSGYGYGYGYDRRESSGKNEKASQQRR